MLTSYDDDLDSSNSFSLSLNFSATQELKTTKSRNKSGEEVTEKEYKQEVQVTHIVKKLYSGNTEAYFKWNMNLHHVLKKHPCESPKAKLDMVEAILYGDLL